MLIPVYLDSFFFLNEQVYYEKILQSQGGDNTSFSCQCYKELVLNSSALRAVTVNGGRNEQEHVSPGSATSLLWDLRQTLTSTGFNVSTEGQSFLSAVSDF